MSKARNKFSREIRERAVRLVLDQEAERSSRWSAIQAIAPKIDCLAQTLNEWIKRAEALQQALPNIITVIAGGIAASILFPRWQEQFNRRKNFAERRLQLLKEETDAFSRYLIDRKRLMYISAFDEAELSQDQMAMKQGFFSPRKRDSRKSCGPTSRKRISFRRSTYNQVKRFLDWDTQLTVAQLSEPPPIEEWWNWHDTLTSKMRLDVE